MGRISEYEPVKLMVGVLYSAFEGETEGEQRFESVLESLTAAFGPCDYCSRPLPFSFTRYYDREMRPPLLKRLLSFEKLIDPMELASVKAATNAMEEQWQTPDRRPVNLDPGTVSLSSLILATTKNRGHRFAIGGGIYGELTLIFIDGAFRPQPWTYADFATDEYRSILAEIRERYRPQRTAALHGRR